MKSSLSLYRRLDRIGWLRTYSRKVLFVAFLGTHFPLIVLIVYLSTRDEPLGPSTAIVVTLIATLIGTIAVLWTLDRLLAPIRLATGALGSYLETGDVQELPGDLHDEAGALLRDVSRSVNAFERHRRELEEVAQTDTLTGLRNRRGMEKQMRALEVDCVSRSSHNPACCFALIDIDHFKAFNDSWGHGVGDLALQQVARSLQATLAAMPGLENAVLARWGGEEFLAFLPVSASRAYECVETMRADLRALLFRVDTDANAEDGEPGLAIAITISAGIHAVAPGESFEQSVLRADHALYQAKVEGRDRVRLATKS